MLPPRARERARNLYMEGHTLAEAGRRARVSAATVKRWARAGEWTSQREQLRRLESESRSLAVEMVAAAAESLDPQQAYAALKVGQAAGMGARPPLQLTPREVARAFIRVLGEHPDLGPLVLKHRREVVDLVAAEAGRMEEDGL